MKLIFIRMKLIEQRVYELLLEKFGKVEEPEEVDYCPECHFSHDFEKEDAKKAHEEMGDVELYDELNESEELDEVAPPGWSGTVKAMKKHKNIKSPFALAWSMKNKGAHPHIKPEK